MENNKKEKKDRKNYNYTLIIFVIISVIIGFVESYNFLIKVFR
jgi:cytoskeletal protein RodZ